VTPDRVAIIGAMGGSVDAGVTISLVSWLAVKTGLAALPEGVSWRQGLGLPFC
jgi:NhaA family Na+:H+ antiporter